MRVVQRLDADAIARDEQRARSRVPDREAEHAAQPGDRVRAPLLVGVNDDFGVGRRVERWPAASSSRAQLAEVVDLAVEHDPDRAVLVVNRLMAGRQIDDAQAAHPERHALVDPARLRRPARDGG